MEKNDEISEDDLKELTEKVQKLTDKSIEKIDKAVENKTKEILPFNRSFLLHKTDRGRGSFPVPVCLRGQRVKACACTRF